MGSGLVRVGVLSLFLLGAPVSAKPVREGVISIRSEVESCVVQMLALEQTFPLPEETSLISFTAVSDERRIFMGLDVPAELTLTGKPEIKKDVHILDETAGTGDNLGHYNLDLAITSDGILLAHLSIEQDLKDVGLTLDWQSSEALFAGVFEDPDATWEDVLRGETVRIHLQEFSMEKEDNVGAEPDLDPIAQRLEASMIKELIEQFPAHRPQVDRSIDYRVNGHPVLEVSGRKAKLTRERRSAVYDFNVRLIPE